MADWGSLILSHYEKFLRSPVSSTSYRGHQGESRVVQVLEYDRVFPKCRLFATFGLSHYPEELGGRYEIVLPVDDGWDEISRILANSAFYTVQHRMKMGWGLAVGGIPALEPEFARKYSKSALYFARPVLFPEEFGHVRCDEGRCEILLAFFISKAEFDCFLDRGAQVLESFLEKHQVDPFALSRRSIL
jgi:hypothetical protein